MYITDLSRTLHAYTEYTNICYINTSNLIHSFTFTNIHLQQALKLNNYIDVPQTS